MEVSVCMSESDHQGHPALCATGPCGDPSHPFSDFPFIVAKADEGFQKELCEVLKANQKRN